MKEGAAEKIMDGVKKSRAKRIKLSVSLFSVCRSDYADKVERKDNLNIESNLQAGAIKVMLSVALTFIDTCFNRS